VGSSYQVEENIMKSLLKRLDTIIELLLSDREERKREREEKESAENEQRLIDYAKSKNKALPAGNFVNGRDAADRPVHSDGDLVPFGLSSHDKAVLEEFYRR
jgi:hypothetical protein